MGSEREKRQEKGEGEGEKQRSYRSPASLLPVLGELPQPAPASQPAAGGVKQVKVVAIPNTSNISKQAAAAEEARGYVGGAGDAAQVGAVELQ